MPVVKKFYSNAKSKLSNIAKLCAFTHLYNYLWKGLSIFPSIGTPN